MWPTFQIHHLHWPCPLSYKPTAHAWAIALPKHRLGWYHCLSLINTLVSLLCALSYSLLDSFAPTCSHSHAAEHKTNNASGQTVNQMHDRLAAEGASPTDKHCKDSTHSPAHLTTNISRYRHATLLPRCCQLAASRVRPHTGAGASAETLHLAAPLHQCKLDIRASVFQHSAIPAQMKASSSCRL